MDLSIKSICSHPYGKSCMGSLSQKLLPSIVPNFYAIANLMQQNYNAIQVNKINQIFQIIKSINKSIKIHSKNQYST